MSANKNLNQMKLGALISYLMIIVNALFGVFVTPFILSCLGSSIYGVYKTMGSLSASLLILDLGIGGTLMRYIAKYRANSENQKIGSIVAMMIMECHIIIPVIVLTEVVLYHQLDGLYSGSFSAEELRLAKQLFVILSVNIVFNIVDHFLHGIISGYNQFVFGNGLKLIVLIIKIACILLLLPITKSAQLLVGINLLLSVLGTAIQLLYIVKNFGIRLNFNRKEWDPGIFRESFRYTLMIFLTTIVAQVNNNLDNVIIGSFLGAEKVTVYSFGLVIFGMFEQLSTAISGVALPTVSRIIIEEDWQRKTQEFVVKLGRIQFMLLGAAATGFIALGKEFLNLWLGSGYQDVYWIVLILMLPALFELCVNVCLAVLRAKNMLGFRTSILVISTLLNLVISVGGIRKYGYYSAAVGTAMSFIVGSLVIMNIYYHRKFGFHMLRIYAGILRGTCPCLIGAGLAVSLSARILNRTLIAFILNMLIFMLVYAGSMLVYGCSDEESSFVRALFSKYVKKGK